MTMPPRIQFRIFNTESPAHRRVGADYAMHRGDVIAHADAMWYVTNEGDSFHLTRAPGDSQYGWWLPEEPRGLAYFPPHPSMTV